MLPRDNIGLVSSTWPPTPDHGRGCRLVVDELVVEEPPRGRPSVVSRSAEARCGSRLRSDPETTRVQKCCASDPGAAGVSKSAVAAGFLSDVLTGHHTGTLAPASRFRFDEFYVVRSPTAGCQQHAGKTTGSVMIHLGRRAEDGLWSQGGGGRMTTEALVIDCDGHILEPPDLWETLGARLSRLGAASGGLRRLRISEIDGQRSTIFAVAARHPRGMGNASTRRGVSASAMRGEVAPQEVRGIRPSSDRHTFGGGVHTMDAEGRVQLLTARAWPRRALSTRASCGRPSCSTPSSRARIAARTTVGSPTLPRLRRASDLSRSLARRSGGGRASSSAR